MVRTLKTYEQNELRKEETGAFANERTEKSKSMVK